MEYVFVGSKPGVANRVNYNIHSIQQAENLLISLIEILNGGGIPAMNMFYRHVQNLKSQFSGFDAFIDSGGYSIIVGDVKFSNIRQFIHWYCEALAAGKDIYDYIFSLDIPIFLNEPERNNKVDIKECNRESITQTLEKLKEHDLFHKWYFIYQFKIKDQYDIWSELYDELKLGDHIKYRALGGMVGLRGITQIDFSPFIGPMYRCLLDYLDGDTTVPFQLHSLGVYIQHDRFFLCLLEKLFNYYLKTDNTHLTYDSVNYMRTAQFKVKDLPIYTFRSRSKIEIIKHIELPEEILRSVYNTDATYNGILEEIERVKADTNLIDVDSFTPLSVYSNVQLDKFFSYIIDRYNIVDNLVHNPMRIKHTLEQLGGTHPNVFSSQRIQSLRSNFNKLLPFHYWFTHDRRRTSLAPIMDRFIADINFPAHLEDQLIQKDPGCAQSAFNKLSGFAQFTKGVCNGNES